MIRIERSLAINRPGEEDGHDVVISSDSRSGRTSRGVLGGWAQAVGLRPRAANGIVPYTFRWL